MDVTVIGSAGAVSPEERALRDLYLEHGPELYAYVLRMLGGDTYRTRKAQPAEVNGNVRLWDMSAGEDDIERMLSSMTVRGALRSLTPARREALQATVFADRTTQQAAG